MKVRKSLDIQRTLIMKGFILDTEKKHHKFYSLHANGKKQAIYTYFSHKKKDYGQELMSEVRKQLKFRTSEEAELFFDCPMTKEDYIRMLIEQEEIQNQF